MRIVIGEDEALFRAGLTHILRAAGNDVVATAADGEELVRLAVAKRPDLVVTDIRMPPTHTDEGLRAAGEIRRRVPAMGIVVLSQHVQRRYAVELLAEQTTGIGYLLKQRIADVDTFLADLDRVGAGATVLDPEVVAMMVTRARRNPAMDRLTPRQREVLALLAEGRSNAAIARRLGISPRSVVEHTSHIYDALDLPESDDEHRRVVAALRFLSQD